MFWEILGCVNFIYTILLFSAAVVFFVQSIYQFTVRVINSKFGFSPTRVYAV